jgi:HlyD family secretion protein
MKKFAFFLLILLLIAGISLFIYRRLPPKETDGMLSLSGNVEVTEANIGFKHSGRVAEMLAEEGQKVLQADKLSVLENAELQSLIEQNKALLREARIRLSELKKGSRPQEVEQAAAEAASIQSELNRLKKDYERSQMLYANGAVSVSQFDAAKSAYESMASKHKSASEKLNLIREGAREEQIQAAKARVQQAKSALEAAEERLKDTVLHAPFSGVILLKNAELGEIMAAGTPVYTLGDLERPWIKVYVKEDQLGRVKLGQRAAITVDSYPGKIYEGQVTYISSEAEFTPKNVQTQEERIKLVFGVKVRVKNENQELKPGMPADVLIDIK